jgi:4-amino-4-deoxy-L-arabinose transferase-like glycosyltransferase
MVMNIETNTPEQLPRRKLLFPLEPLYDSRRFALTFTAIYFAVLLFFGLTFHKVGNFEVESDFYWEYAVQARDFLLGKVIIDPYHGPLYPWILGLFSKIFGDLFKTGIVISALSASLSLFLIFGILKSVFSSDVAFVSTILVAVNKSFVQYSYTAGTDMFFVAVSLAGLFMLFRKPVITVLELCLSAACMSLAYLVRYNGFVFLLIIPLVILLRSIQVKGLTKYSAVVIWVMVFIAFAAPWSIYLKLNCGSFFYNKNYQNIAYEVFAKGGISWERFWFLFANKFTSYSDVILKAPLLFLVTVSTNAITHLVSDAVLLNNTSIGVLSILGGLLFSISHPDRRKTGLILTYLSFFLVLLPVFYWERFSLFLVPMYAVFFTILFKTLLSKSGGRRGATILLDSIFIIVLVISYADSYSFNSKNISSGPNEVLAIRDWFQKQYGHEYDNARILTRTSQIAYYLDMQCYPFPMIDDYGSLLTLMKRDSVKFLYYGIFEATTRPKFLGLFRLDTIHAGLKPLCYSRTPAAVLYEVTN